MPSRFPTKPRRRVAVFLTDAFDPLDSFRRAYPIRIPSKGPGGAAVNGLSWGEWHICTLSAIMIDTTIERSRGDGSWAQRSKR
jgi:hypothetical protein